MNFLKQMLIQSFRDKIRQTLEEKIEHLQTLVEEYGETIAEQSDIIKGMNANASNIIGPLREDKKRHLELIGNLVEALIKSKRDTDPTYDPAEHWGEDFTVDTPDPIECVECHGSGRGWGGNHMEPPEPCHICEGSGYNPDGAPPDEPEEIDLELQGVEL